MQNDYSQFEQRKRDHIELALLPTNQSTELNVFDQFHLVHEALPDIDFKDISTHCSRLGCSVPTPFIISSMTAGHTQAISINERFMEACSQSGWAMGVGSQRREITDSQATKEWIALRKAFPKVCLFSNLGIAQLITTPLATLLRLTEAIQAQALIIHCNPLQECIQPEGTPQFKGAFEALTQLIPFLPIPVVIKETGCGFSKNTLTRLNDLGVAAVELSGAGGTHWGRIEGHRATQDPIRQQTALTFANWGINTLQSLVNANDIHPSFEIWGSGGVRNGLDAAKLIALGATTVGFAKPILEAALQSTTEVVQKMATIEYELKTAMFCTGSLTLSDLKEKACL
jgi:isopentenyl-diphosphate delta-isomerase